jgi:hypothetical protein
MDNRQPSVIDLDHYITTHMVAPQVNLNGESGLVLSQRWADINDAAAHLLRLLAAAQPHGRDYQTVEDPQTALGDATDAHWAAREAAAVVASYAVAMMHSLSDQGYYKGVRYEDR